MFVRWKKRKSDDGQRSSLAAYLVQSVRLDGKPRQRVMAYLGVPQARSGWWCDVEEKLYALHLNEGIRKQVLQTLAQKASRPSEEEMKEAYASRAAFREQYPPPPVVPHTPPPLVPSGTTEEEEERPLLITWKVQQPRVQPRKDAQYTASLAKSVSIDGKNHLSIITSLGSLGAHNLQGDRWGWKRFWYQVHGSLCLAQVDRETYHETIRLLSMWVKPPTPEELVQIIQHQLNADERSTQKHLESALVAVERWLKKSDDLRTVRSRESQYFGKEKVVPHV